MRKRDNSIRQYHLIQPPKVLLQARLDNIAIVPASMLPFTKLLKEKINNLPQGAVFLCYAKENTKQRKILERVEEVFNDHGHEVTNLSMEQVL
jgi:peptidase E